jgi:hypothetical protein
VTAYVEVNECRVNATEAGRHWWTAYRFHHEPTGRITTVTASIGGDRVRVACDDRAHAEWLATHMIEMGCLPKSAIRIGVTKAGAA